MEVSLEIWTRTYTAVVSSRSSSSPDIRGHRSPPPIGLQVSEQDARWQIRFQGRCGGGQDHQFLSSRYQGTQISFPGWPSGVRTRCPVAGQVPGRGGGEQDHQFPLPVLLDAVGPCWQDLSWAVPPFRYMKKLWLRKVMNHYSKKVFVLYYIVMCKNIPSPKFEIETCIFRQIR